VKYTLWLFFVSLVAIGSATSGLTPPVYAQQQTVVAYRDFQPSKVKKQKRVLRQRVSTWGWGVLTAALLLVAGLTWLVIWLWPLVAIVWRVLLLIGAISVSAVLIGMALFLFSYAYPTQRDVRSSAEIRIRELGKVLPFEAESVWCFPDDQFRFSLMANTEGLLVVDYEQDHAWQIPQSNIEGIGSDFVPADSATTVYPATTARVVLLAKKTFQTRTAQPPYSSGIYTKPMQVLDFKLTGLPIEHLTVVYRGAVYSDSTQHIADHLRSLWSQ
jgi:hypothetical protein